jgi:CRP/FNR family cyclic AMP-dependent transcriptional regulator
MPNSTNQAVFDPKEFLAKVGEGKTILEFRTDEIVFAQGDVANTVFYIQRGRVKVVSYRSKARKPWSAFWGPASFLAKAA